MQLSPHFSLAEFTHSQLAARYGIDNTPPDAALKALTQTAAGLEKIRALLDGPVVISSGYRCSQLNKRSGGVPGSQHVRGEAADILAPKLTPTELAGLIRANKQTIGYDQLILEYPERGGWVHVSFCGSPRGEELTKTGKGTQKGLVA